MTTPHASETLSRGLLALREAVPYDLAVVYALHGDQLRARAAEGPLADGRVIDHRLALADYPSIRRALASRRPAVLSSAAHRGAEGDPYDGVLDLAPGHSCMVVPLHAGPRDLGVITLDHREPSLYGESTIRWMAVAGQLLGLTLSHAEDGSGHGPVGRFDDNERAYFEALLAQSGGRIYGAGGAAETAGLKPTTLHSKLRRHGLR